MNESDEILQMVLAETLFAPPPRPLAETQPSASASPDPSEPPSDDGET